MTGCRAGISQLPTPAATLTPRTRLLRQFALIIRGCTRRDNIRPSVLPTHRSGHWRRGCSDGTAMRVTGRWPRRSATDWPCCRAGKVRHGLWLMRPDGRTVWPPWPRTGSPAGTGRGIKRRTRVKSMSWVSGCTPSVTSCVVANSIQRKRWRWTPKRRAGGLAGSVAGSPSRQFQVVGLGRLGFAFIAINGWG